MGNTLWHQGILHCVLALPVNWALKEGGSARREEEMLFQVPLVHQAPLGALHTYTLFPQQNSGVDIFNFRIINYLILCFILTSQFPRGTTLCQKIYIYI